MSTKKKIGISDLLRDEVQKEPESPVGNEQTIEVKAETIIEKPPSDDGTKSKISALESALARSQKQETELLQAIANLQKDLQFSHTNTELLQKSLAAIESLKNELNQQLVEVKRDNLRLAEANIQLSAQVKTLESAKAPVVESPSSSQLVSQNSQGNRATPRKQPVEQPHRTSYTRPTGSNEQLQRINNKNIGWMD